MWKLRPEDRLKAWRSYRSELASMPITDVISSLSEVWSQAPYSPFYLDCSDSKNWPDPWLLMYENHFCDVAKGLGLFYTLQYAMHPKVSTLEFRAYNSNETQTDHGVVFINEHIFKSQFGSIINTQQEKLNKDKIIKVITLDTI